MNSADFYTKKVLIFVQRKVIFVPVFLHLSTNRRIRASF